MLFPKGIYLVTLLKTFISKNLNYSISASVFKQYRVWARREAVDSGQVDYALDIGVRILTYFEDYFNVSFPLPKQGTCYSLIFLNIIC